MTNREFKKVALVNVDGDYIAPVAYSAKFTSGGLDIQEELVDIQSDLATKADKTLANLSSVGESHFDTRYLKNTPIGAYNTPIYVNASGNAQPITQISKTLIINSGVRVVTESYSNGPAWYRVWSDGWIEQGGLTGNGNYIHVDFWVSFSNINYTLVTGTYNEANDNAPTYYTSAIANAPSSSRKLTKDGFTVIGWSSGWNTSWYACGY